MVLNFTLFIFVRTYSLYKWFFIIRVSSASIIFINIRVLSAKHDTVESVISLFRSDIVLRIGVA